MGQQSSIRTVDVLALRRAFVQAAPDRAEQLRALANRRIHSARTLREWHDLLLFVAAHPSDDRNHADAISQLSEIPERVAHVRGAEQTLTNSGVAGAPVEASVSRALVHWLLTRWPDKISLLAMESDEATARRILRTLLLPAEIEAVDLLDGTAEELLVQLFGASQAVQITQLIARLDALPASDAVRDQLFAQLDVHVRIDGSAPCTLSASRAPSAAPYNHAQPLLRDVDVAATIAEPLGKPVFLSPKRQRALIETARTVLASMQRETDPVTHASAVSLHDMGRGLRIALFSLDQAHRLPFDSYVGFMAFRNGIPLAYGGAWIFPERSKIGINVFPSQRGGESAWFFAQLLRLYHHRYGVTRFEAENYQLGHGNPEGLRSGAYWFYYRAGFRPVDAPLARAAAREARQLLARRSHRVPRRLLKTLVAEGLELQLRQDAGIDASGDTVKPVDTALLTVRVQQHIVEHYDGDRARCERLVLARVRRALCPATRLTPQERQGYRLLALPLDLVSSLESWPAAERRRLDAIVRAKGADDELRHQQLLAACPRLIDAWRDVLAG